MNCTLSAEAEIEDLRRKCAELQRQVEKLRARHRERLSLAAETHRSLLPQPLRVTRVAVSRAAAIESRGSGALQR